MPLPISRNAKRFLIDPQTVSDSNLWRQWTARNQPETAHTVPATIDNEYMDTHAADPDTRHDYNADRHSRQGKVRLAVSQQGEREHLWIKRLSEDDKTRLRAAGYEL